MQLCNYSAIMKDFSPPTMSLALEEAETDKILLIQEEKIHPRSEAVVSGGSNVGGDLNAVAYVCAHGCQFGLSSVQELGDPVQSWRVLLKPILTHLAGFAMQVFVTLVSRSSLALYVNTYMGHNKVWIYWAHGVMWWCLHLALLWLINQLVHICLEVNLRGYGLTNQLKV